MKYIPADKLIAEIERRIKETKSMKPVFDQFWAGQISAFKGVIKLIDSLQQEQRETDGDDGKFVKILVRKEFAEQLQKLGDEIQAGQSSFIGAMNQQEQQEIDLEKEIDSEWKKCNPIDEGMGVESAYIHIEAFDIIAHHFFELGYNARKEE